MEAKLDQVGDVFVVRLVGKIDLETQQNFRNLCKSRFQKAPVVFCLAGLKFVGSSGIQSFFRTLCELNSENPHRIRVTGVKEDFLRLLNYSKNRRQRVLCSQSRLHDLLELPGLVEFSRQHHSSRAGRLCSHSQCRFARRWLAHHPPPLS